MKFGVREICDVVFKAAANGQKLGRKTFDKYQPVFMIDTAKTSNMEQASTTVYAQGGRGNARLIAWEGEKTLTFTVEDALISPMGLAVLTGAGLIDAKNQEQAIVHATVQTSIKNGENNKKVATITLEDLQEETGLSTATKFTICKDIGGYATTFANTGANSGFYMLDLESAAAGELIIEKGAGTDSVDIEVKATDGNAPSENEVVILDFYLYMTNSVTTVEILPESFGGYFYVEAQTLFRDESTGKDMAANLTFPKVKIQSAFTFTMASSGDPSTFTFTMDAFPGYAINRPKKKTMCDMQIIFHEEDNDDKVDQCDEEWTDTPSFHKADNRIDISDSTTVPTNHIPAGFPDAVGYQQNQSATTVTVNQDTINVGFDIADLAEWTSTDPDQALLGDIPWIALDIDTGVDDITKLTFNGTNIPEDEVTGAAAWGLGAGHLILWVNASDTARYSGDGRKITLAGNAQHPEIEAKDIYIKFA